MRVCVEQTEAERGLSEAGVERAGPVGDGPGEEQGQRGETQRTYQLSYIFSFSLTVNVANHSA